MVNKNHHPTPESNNSQTEYTLNYGWGIFNVTKLANKYYAFTPLTCETVPKQESDPFASNMTTAITLVSPKEFNNLQQHIPSTQNKRLYIDHGLGYGVSKVDKNGVDLTISLSKTLEERISELDNLRNLAKSMGVTLETYQIPGQMSLQESINHDMSSLIHDMDSLIFKILKHATMEYLTSDYNKKRLRTITQLGAVSLMGSGSILAINEVLRNPDLLTFSSLMSYLAIQSVSLRKHFKYILSNHPDDYKRIEKLSYLYAQKATNDIHNTYCPDYFNERAEQMFQQ